MQNVRNVAIIMLLALVVAAVPGGGNAADTILLALQIAFLAAIAFAVYRLYLSQEMTLATLTDGRRALLFGSVGAIALLIAGYEQFDSWTRRRHRLAAADVHRADGDLPRLARRDDVLLTLS